MELPNDQGVVTEPGTSRRQVLAKVGVGATIAWTAPVVTSMFSMAAAASACVPAVNMAFGTGWTETRSPGTWGPDLLGLSTTYGSTASPWLWTPPGAPSANRYVVESNPPSNNSTVSYARSVSLTGGKTYTFSFTSIGRTVNPHTLRLDAQINSVTRLSFTTADGRVDQWQSNHSFTYTPPTTGSYTFRFLFTRVGSGSGATDDIAVTAPVVTC